MKGGKGEDGREGESSALYQSYPELGTSLKGPLCLHWHALSKRVCVPHTYPEVLAGDGQEEEGKGGHNAKDYKD